MPDRDTLDDPDFDDDVNKFLYGKNNVPSEVSNDGGGGKKYDSGKSRLDLIAPELMDEVGKVLAFGAAKYGDRNWELGMDWGRPYAALLRHIIAWWRGEENDAESGLSHLSHAACNIMFLLAYSKRKVGKDTRFTEERYG